ncbi:MAG: hypothetical protein ISR69_11155 [Gammaproteobacteria bacterium]|nr:hypothetical protein [Gammaproteobacteria bacterium]
MNKTLLSQEWQLLQNQFDSYEKHSLYIKLVCIILFSFLIGKLPLIILILLVIILWLQDAIWKTFQARIEIRLLSVEKSIVSNSDLTEFQFNTHYLNNRTGVSGLIKEYLSNMFRPTIAYPYALILVILGIV